MTGETSALSQQFRSSLETRARHIAASFEDYKRSPANALHQELKGELHTLKGEARILGLGDLATVVHGIETLVQEEADFDLAVVSAGLDAVLMALGEGTSEARRQQLLSTAIEALGMDSTAEPEAREAEETPDGDLVSDTEAQPHLRKGRRWVQVDAAVVDELCEALAALSNQLGGASTRAEQAFSSETEHESSAARSFLHEVAACRTRLDESVVRAFSLRLAPVEPTLVELASHLRQIASETNKQVEVVVEARGVQLERDTLRSLWDPLLHLGRNSVVHGIEPMEDRGRKPPVGSVQIRAFTSGTQVVVSITDDGRGIQLDRVRQQAVRTGILTPDAAKERSREELVDLLFEAGFSTQQDADQWAGRGIGLDVVKRQVQEVGGDVAVETEEGAGTTFTLSVPASVMKERLFVFEVQATLFAVPTHLVLAVERRDRGEGDAPAPISAESVQSFDGDFLPLRSLSDVLFNRFEESEPFVAILQLGGKRYAAAFSAFVGEHDLIRRPAGSILSKISGLTASAMIEGGRVALVLDAKELKASLQRSAGSNVETRVARSAERGEKVTVPRILAADDSPIVRDLVSEVLTAVGYQVKCAVDGLQALEWLDSFTPTLVLSDIEMPKMDGFELLEAIRARTRTLPVILLTARGSMEDRQRASALGANAYVAKGEFRRETLVELVDRFCPQVS